MKKIDLLIICFIIGYVLLLYYGNKEINRLNSKLQEQFSGILDTALNSNFTPAGVEWIHWFMYEADYGTKDFSRLPTYQRNSEGKLVLVHAIDEVRWGAHDENGKPICYSFESPWDYVQQYKK